jgi:hypothetical protein
MSIKNKNAKPANQIKKPQGLTVDQHLNNILFGLKKSTMTWDEQESVKVSFNHIANLLLAKKEEEKSN